MGGALVRLLDEHDDIMKLPRHHFGLRACGISFLAAMAMHSGAEPEVLPVRKAGLDPLAEISASKFTKIIDQSTSPNKRLAVGVGSLDGSVPAWEELDHEKMGNGPGHSFTMDDRHCANYLIDLRADRVTGVLGSGHFGTRNSYNHESAGFSWSPDNCWLVEEQQWRFQTGTCIVHRVSAEGRLGAQLDLKTTAEKVVDQQLRKNLPKLTPDERGAYVATISVLGISNDGVLNAAISAQIPKQESESVDLFVAARLEQDGDGKLSIHITKVERHKE